MIELRKTDKEEMETVLLHLMTQFRHISVKYDLMVKEEIEIRYAKNNQSMIAYEKELDSLMLKG